MEIEKAVVAAIGAVGVIAGASIPAYLAYLSRREEQKLRKIAEEREAEIQEIQATLELHRQTFAMSEFLNEWEHIREYALEIMRTSNWDRFLYLRAWNGLRTPEYVTAVIQLRQGDQEPTAYVDVKIDLNYIGNLRFVRQNGAHLYRIQDFPEDSLMHSVYGREGIGASYWMHLCTYHAPTVLNKDAAAIDFASIATHGEEVNENDLVLAKLLHGRLQSVAEKIVGPSALISPGDVED